MSTMNLDLATVLDRRHALKVLGGLGLLALGACATDERDTASSTTSTSSAECSEPIPEETGGPYPGDGTNGPNVLDEAGVVRSDIRTSFGSMSGTADGVPLTIELALLDTSKGCAAMSGAAVYLWHCDRQGRYSLYSNGVTDQNYLRGVQEADADGKVRFTSIFPAAYSGRWPHIHFEIYRGLAQATSSGTPVTTSQLALPEDVCRTVYASAGYEASVRNLAQTSLTRDMVFGDDGAVHQLATVTGSISAGYAASLSVPV